MDNIHLILLCIVCIWPTRTDWSRQRFSSGLEQVRKLNNLFLFFNFVTKQHNFLFEPLKQAHKLQDAQAEKLTSSQAYKLINWQVDKFTIYQTDKWWKYEEMTRWQDDMARWHGDMVTSKAWGWQKFQKSPRIAKKNG